eukprot:scaffold141091_cov29-Tisochrysis_lutea.AAC.2
MPAASVEEVPVAPPEGVLAGAIDAAAAAGASEWATPLVCALMIPLLEPPADALLADDESREGPSKLSRSCSVSTSVLGRLLKRASTSGTAAAVAASRASASETPVFGGVAGGRNVSVPTASCEPIRLSARILRSMVAFSTYECQPDSTRLAIARR